MPALVSINRMLEAVRESDDSLALHRQRLAEAKVEFEGRYGGNPSGPQRPLNLIHRGVTVLRAHLAARNPQHEVTPIDDLSLRGEAKKIGLKLDMVGYQLDRASISRLCIVDALLGPKAIVKVGLRVGGDVFKLNGKNYDIGEPYIQRIDLDDWLCDPTARCRDELLWEGHRYRCPRLQAAESGLFNPDVIMALPSVQDAQRRQGVDQQGRPMLRTDSDIADQIELMDVVFYSNGGAETVATMPSDPAWAEDYLRIEPYEGSNRGPYHWLEFCPVPNRLHGVPWASIVREQSEIASKLMLKWVNESLRSKKLGLIEENVSDDEAKKVKDAPDSAWIKVQNPKAYGMVDLSTAMAELPAAIRDVMQWWNIQSGNVDILGGTSEGGGTATAFSGLAANAGIVMNDMAMIHEAFETDISRDIAFYLTTDPGRPNVLLHRLPGGEFVPLVYDASTRENDFLNYVFKIRQRSMQGQDPNARAARIVNAFNTVIAGVEAAMATGGALDPFALARKMGDIQDIDGLEDVVKDPVALMQKQQLLASMPQPGFGQMGQFQGNPQAGSYMAQPQMGGGQNPGAGKRPPRGIDQVRSSMPQMAGAGARA